MLDADSNARSSHRKVNESKKGVQVCRSSDLSVLWTYKVESWPILRTRYRQMISYTLSLLGVVEGTSEPQEEGGAWTLRAFGTLLRVGSDPLHLEESGFDCAV